MADFIRAAQAAARKARQLQRRVDAARTALEGLHAQADATRQRQDGKSACRYVEAQQAAILLWDAAELLRRVGQHLETLAKFDEPHCNHPECQLNGQQLYCRFPVQAP